MSTPFVHLHNHSEFSLLDGASKIKDMVKYAVEMEMPALALTDHGVMYGSFEFYTAARAAGIKPLIGSELYVATRGRKDRDPKRDGNHHLVAIAKNETGYKNLMKLVTLASLEGFYYKPRVDKELLAEYSEGLIICSACMGGELAQAIMKQSYEDAKNVAAWYREVFKDDFYLEVQGHHANGQWDVNADVKRISREMGIKMVATNDSHYLKAEDADPHDVLICIQTGTTVNDPKRMRYEPREFYLKTYAEMMGEFEHFAPDAIENTLEVAEKVNFEIEVGRAPMPVVGVDPGSDAQTTITRMCWEGLERRLPKNELEHKERLTYELDIIEKTGFAQYFLIVRDIAQHARQSGIFFGVRGSAAGSLASYCLGITDLDPIEYNLTFERFLNPERVQMPDIDMDFEDTRRAEVIEHVTQQYGKDNVSYITTFGTLGAKAALRDAGRALAMPLPDVDRIARMIPALPLGISITRAMHGWPEKDYPGNPEMVAAYESEELAHKLIDTAKRIEGITRNESVHAAGVMIADRPLVEYTPLRKLNDGSLATQYPHSSLEAIGLLKMDFLGLVNLSILSRAVKLIQQTRGETVDVWDIPLHYDEPRAQKAYDMLGRGETTGVFQLESSGMRKYIVELKPNSVKELSAMVALYRPGPLAHIPRFIQSKFDPDKIEYEHPLLEPILKETYGVIVYQDQVLKIVQAVGGLTLGQADLLRRAMGKKQRSYMDKQKGIFMEGAKERGVSTKSADKIFSDIEPFAGYAFNGAHAACYAMVAYQTAYMKANYTAEYLAALMAAYVDKTEKVVNTLEECERLGIEILPPDVNESDADFTVREPTDKKKYQGAIRFGLLAIKNIGKSPIETILQARAKGGKFISLPDFATRVFAEGLTSKSVIEMLIKAGTFKSIHPNRRALMETLDDAVAAAARGAKDAKAGLISLWGDDAGDDAASVESVQPLPNVPDHPRGVWLGWEKELLGLYLTEHPVKPFEPELRRKWRAWRADQISESTPNQQVTVGGMITEVRTKYTKTGNAMLFVTLEDTTGAVSVTLFPKCAAEWGKYCIVNSVVAIIGRAQHRERILKSDVAEEGAEPAAADKNVQIELIADKIERIVENAMAADARPRTVHVRIDPNNRTLLHMVKEMFTSKDGGSPLVVHAETPSGEYLIKTPILVDPDEGLIEQIRRMLGGGHQKAWVE
ncbi:DNA polymerase III subunit alpha [Armatimonas sp.]|uniref:DNA polymerase III subunit alpha n=1 Tax=Armatimonas sp. TaxID=1872638 RepID=UPI00374D16E5